MTKRYGKLNWYTRPRKFDKFIRWIIFNPKSLSILMVMGHLIAVVLFVILFVWAMFSGGMFLKFISFCLVSVTVYNLIKYYRFQRKTGSIFTNINVNDMVFGGKKK